MPLVLALACSEPSAPLPEPPPAAPPAPSIAGDAEAWTVPVPELRRAALELDARASEGLGTVEGVAAGRSAARLARVLALRDPDGDWLGRARAWLNEASRRGALEGSCEAALELAELEARDAGDLDAAYRAALRTKLRFQERGAPQRACARRAERMLRTLEPWRPSAASLAAIEADPDLDDPTAVARDPEPAAPVDPVAAWAAAHAAHAASLEGVLVYGQGEAARSARAVLRFDGVVAYEHGESDEPTHRTWLQIPSARAGEGVQSEIAVGSGGLRRIAVASREGALRVDFELDPGAGFRSFALTDPFRIVLDFEREPSARAEGPIDVIVIDPGHGADDYGGRAFGLHESDLVLDIALRARAILAARLPGARVILTRDRDVFVSLEQRTAMANALDADLFVSIHLNAADEPVEHGGVTTFVLDTTDDRQALRLAARENGTSPSEVGDLARILAGLHREEQVRASRALAEEVHRSTLLSGRRHVPRLYDRGVRSALFHVLVGARMPAILVEGSFLTRQDEADQLRTPRYRQALAEGIAGGVIAYAHGS